MEFSDTLDAYLDVEELLNLDLIVPVWTMDTITSEQLQGLLVAVKGTEFRNSGQFEKPLPSSSQAQKLSADAKNYTER